jgi:hypothetical protein
MRTHTIATPCCCGYCGSLYLRPVPEIIYASSDEELVRLLTPPPAPTIETVLAERGWLDRFLIKLEWRFSGEVPNYLQRELEEAEAEWGRMRRLWEALWYCERCRSVCLLGKREAARVETMWEFLSFCG